ncbi:cytochrome P450 [Xanthovirga aplysinae]|uniref:cytochrome P450 n=1 Tax=Xanthovirga aplysinae TaxID=2529853 RepID=UPI0012BC9FE0|nr:cytochrome P450 [Xanthovirga aplysinae]MTI33175.1 cytochrome P450 [Xanthovirga aplysinae]
MKSFKYPRGPIWLSLFMENKGQMVGSPNWYQKNFKKYGDSFSLQIGFNEKAIFTQDEEFVEYILKKNPANYKKSKHSTHHFRKFMGLSIINTFGQEWTNHKRSIQSSFHLNKIKSLYVSQKQSIDAFLKNLPTGRAIDIYPFLQQMTLNVLTNCLLSTSLKSANLSVINQHLTEILDYLVIDIRTPLTAWWRQINGQEKKIQLKVNKIKDIIGEIIDIRLKNKEHHFDLIDLLLSTNNTKRGWLLNREKIINEILALLFLGSKSSANALSWTLHLLARHPKETRNLRARTKNFTVEECVLSPQILATLKESMRLFPPVWIIERTALKDDSFKSFSFQKGTLISLFIYGLHHNKKLWKKPESFIPERFLQDQNKETIRKAYYPFGAGPRGCMGYHFALSEMAIFLHTFIHQFDIKASFLFPEMVPQVTLRPDKVILHIKRKWHDQQKEPYFNQLAI